MEGYRHTVLSIFGRNLEPSTCRREPDSSAFIGELSEILSVYVYEAGAQSHETCSKLPFNYRGNYWKIPNSTSSWSSEERRN